MTENEAGKSSERLEIPVTGMSCASCSAKIEDVLGVGGLEFPEAEAGEDLGETRETWGTGETDETKRMWGEFYKTWKAIPKLIEYE